MATTYEVKRIGDVKKNTVFATILKDKYRGLSLAQLIAGNMIVMLPKSDPGRLLDVRFVKRHLCRYTNEPEGVFESLSDPKWVGFIDVSSGRCTLTYQSVPNNISGIMSSICKIEASVEAIYSIDLTTYEAKHSVFQDVKSLNIAEITNPIAPGEQFAEFNKTLASTYVDYSVELSKELKQMGSEVHDTETEEAQTRPNSEGLMMLAAEGGNEEYSTMSGFGPSRGDLKPVFTQSEILSFIMRDQIGDSISGAAKHPRSSKAKDFSIFPKSRLSPIVANVELVRRLLRTLIKSSPDGKYKRAFSKALAESIRTLNSMGIVEKIRKETFCKQLRSDTKSSMSVIRQRATALLEPFCRLSEVSKLLQDADKFNRQRESDERAFESKNGRDSLITIMAAVEQTLSDSGATVTDKSAMQRMFYDTTIENRIVPFKPPISKLTPCGPCGLYSVHFDPKIIMYNGSSCLKNLFRISIEIELYVNLTSSNPSIITSPSFRPGGNSLSRVLSETSINGNGRMSNAVTEITEMARALPEDFNIPICQASLFRYSNVRYAIELLSKVGYSPDPYRMYGLLAGAFDSIQLSIPDIMSYINEHSGRARPILQPPRLNELILAYCICVAQASSLPRILRFIARSIDVVNHKIMMLCLTTYRGLVEIIKETYRNKMKQQELEQESRIREEETKTYIATRYEKVTNSGVSTITNELKETLRNMEKRGSPLSFECVECGNILQVNQSAFVSEFNALLRTVRRLQGYIGSLFKINGFEEHTGEVVKNGQKGAENADMEVVDEDMNEVGANVRFGDEEGN